MSAQKSPCKMAIASDHGGFALKQKLIRYLQQRGLQVVDFGPEAERSVDYPDFAAQVADAVSRKKVAGGVLACGTGIGMCIAANKFKNVRAALVTDLFTAQMSKEHNNANIICLGGRVLKDALAKKALGLWLDTPFAGDRHARRLKKIQQIERKNFK